MQAKLIDGVSTIQYRTVSDCAYVAVVEPTALAACCGFDLCHKYILYWYWYFRNFRRVELKYIFSQSQLGVAFPEPSARGHAHPSALRVRRVGSTKNTKNTKYTCNTGQEGGPCPRVVVFRAGCDSCLR